MFQLSLSEQHKNQANCQYSLCSTLSPGQASAAKEELLVLGQSWEKVLKKTLRVHLSSRSHFSWLGVCGVKENTCEYYKRSDLFVLVRTLLVFLDFCLFVCLFVYLFFVCLFVCLFACLFVCLFVYLSTCFCLFVCSLVCLFVCLFICPLVYLFVCSLAHLVPGEVLWHRDGACCGVRRRQVGSKNLWDK